MAEEGEVVIRRRRWPRVLAIIAALLALPLLGLWLARKPIARGQADRFLAEAGVPARYGIADLGLGRQRFTNVALGDPARPDLVADWIETRTDWSLRGPYLASVRGGRVRVRARWADGRLSLGSIDRLLPKGQGGKPFALPALALDVADLRARVETPWGVLGAKLAGRGRLDEGFDGRLALTASRLGEACAVHRPGAALRVTTSRDRVRAVGEVGAPAIECAGTRASFARADVDATVSLGSILSWAARTALDVDMVVQRGWQGRRVRGTVIARGRGTELNGAADVTVARLFASGVRATDTRVDGGWSYAKGVLRLGGSSDPARVTAAAVHLPASMLDRVAALGEAAGTPLAPLARQLAAALVRSGRGFSADADVIASSDGRASVTRAALRTPHGAQLALAPDGELAWSNGQARLNGRVTLAGDGLPTATALIQQRASGALIARVSAAPYASDGARLALAPVTVTGSGKVWRITTRAELSGPLPDGRIEGLALPIDARWRGGALTLAGGCTPVAWQAFSLSGFRLDPATIRLCPTGGSLVTIGSGGVTGGASIAATRLTGQLGSSPLALAVAHGTARLADRSFALEGVDASLGASDRVTHLTARTLTGRIGPRGIFGTFADAGGRIGAVPLVMGSAAGDWRFGAGALGVTGALTVADAAAPARFQPMQARDVSLRLAGNAITAEGMLQEPTTGTRVAAVAIRHDLATGAGTAAIDVPALTFAKGFQPNLLTPLTYGVIADVRGTVRGDARIAWSAAGVTSTGTFRTDGADLAAAFGPVQGLAGEIRFTDLLNLRSAPGQRFTVKSINPGVPVTDGVLAIQTLPGARVQVEGARWPFAGGALTLDPTLLDFSAAASRRLTFHVAGAEADKFLQSFDFKNLNATGTFDGVLPMVFDAGGGRIEGGRLTAQPGGGTIAYVGAVNQKNLGFWGNFAFDALKSLRYRQLGIVMNGPLAGEMVTEVRFAGVTQGAGAKSNFIIRRLQRLPIAFNIRIRAPFRGLLDATASFYDPRRLIERNLPELIEKQNRAIQPPASEKVP